MAEGSENYAAQKYFILLSDAILKSQDTAEELLFGNTYSNGEQAILLPPGYDDAAWVWPDILTESRGLNAKTLKLAQDFLHGIEFVSWGELITRKSNDNSRFAKVTASLSAWHSDLPPESKAIIQVNDFFKGPYQNLSSSYRDDQTLRWICQSRLADYFTVVANADEAYECRTKAWVGLTNLKGKEDPLTLQAASKLNLHYIINRDMKRAEEEYLETSRLQFKVLGKTKPDYLQSLHHAAAAQYYMTKYILSIEIQDEAASGLLEIQGPDSLSYLKCVLFKSYALARLGRLHEANDLLKDVFESRSKLHGPENAMALMAQVALAEVQRKLGQLKEAERNLTQAYEVRMKVWGISPFSSIDTVIHLIILCREQGKPEEAWKHIKFVSQPGILEQYFERLCQVTHLEALLLIDAGKSGEATDVLRAILHRGYKKGRESNNRSLLWVRLTLSTILREEGKNNEVLGLFEDIVVSTKHEESDSAPSLDGEPQSPKVLDLAEKALRLVRDRMESEAEALLREYELMWKRENDFWIPSGGPAADTGWMKGP
jgi:tetratricopeptide (TPR) repeat protein